MVSVTGSNQGVSKGSSPGFGGGSENLQPGQKLGRYTLLAPIAQGGMARVWAARQVGIRGFQRLVAIKTIVPALAADAEFERMFLDEARIAAAIHHPNVCEIYDLGETGSTLFLAMEWVNGVSMLALLKARPKVPLPDQVSVRIVANACAGLQAAHELRDETGQLLNVVHRDVSPHNILLSTEGHVKVADFGVAKAMGLEHAPTTAGQLKGKVAYMSPEQAVGETSVDRRSDIFSLGAVLYEAVTGHRAWSGANDVARLQNLLAGNIIPPRKFRPDLPDDLENILAYALAVDPSRRYQTAEQMRLALEQFLVSRRLIVTASQIGKTVRDLCSAEIKDREGRIRQAASVVGEPAEEVVPTPGTLAAYTVQKGGGMRRSTATAISFIAGGITIAGLLGIVAIASIPPRHVAAVSVSGKKASAAVPPTTSAPKPRATVVVVPKPETAVVEVNGIVIGPGTRSFERPGKNEKHVVVVRAVGYKQKTIEIHHDDKKTRWEVVLERVEDAGTGKSASKKTAAPKPNSTAKPVGPRPAHTPRPKPTQHHRGPTKINAPSIPENPF